MSKVFDVAVLDRLVELANRPGVKIRPWRNPHTGVDYYPFDRTTGAPFDGPTFMIDRAITSSRERRRSA